MVPTLERGNDDKYFETGWTDATIPATPLPVALDLKALYEQMLLTYIDLPPCNGETLASLVERVRQIRKYRRELKAVETKMNSEKQFNRKVELNAKVREMQERLVKLTVKLFIKGVSQMTKSDLIRVAVFEGKNVRKIMHLNEWWFSVVDIIEILTGNDRPRKYWSDLKKKLATEGYTEVSEKIGQLKMVASDGKMRETDCANTETMFRIIQSIPSPKVEPLKQWLARVGYERLEEIENPELSMERMQALYEKKGYPKEWIDKRMRGIAVRQDLTDEWKNRGATTSREYAILTNEIMQGAFDLKVDEYKQVKGLARENLRDHMTDIELILTMLGEATTTKLHRDRDSQGIEPLKKDAQEGGAVAGSTRRDIEKRSGKPVVTGDNFKVLSGKGKKIR